MTFPDGTTVYRTIEAIAVLVSAIGSSYAAIRGRSNSQKLDNVHTSVDKVGESVNGKMDQLVHASRAQGRQDERDSATTSKVIR